VTTTHHRARVSIVIDVYDESLLTVLIWARQSAHTLATQLWDHGVLAHVGPRRTRRQTHRHPVNMLTARGRPIHTDPRRSVCKQRCRQQHSSSTHMTSKR
jgi:hypothetical protein